MQTGRSEAQGEWTERGLIQIDAELSMRFACRLLCSSRGVPDRFLPLEKHGPPAKRQASSNQLNTRAHSKTG